MRSVHISANSEKRRRRTITGGLLLLFVLVLLCAMVLTGWEDAVRAFKKLKLWQILALCGLAGLHYLLRAFRWHLLVRTSGVLTSVFQNMRHFFGGFAMTATPGRLGELVRLRWLRLESGWSFGTLLPIAFADRAIELAAIVMVIAFALVLTNLGSLAVWWLLAASMAMVGIACWPKALEAIVIGAWKLCGRRRPRLFIRFRRLTRRLRPFMRPNVFVPTLLFGVIGWSFEGLAFWLLLEWMGADLDIWTSIAIFLIAILSGALSGLPGGLGGTEASAVGLLLLQGVSVETAVLATAIIRITTLWFAVLVGFLVFPIAENRATAREFAE